MQRHLPHEVLVRLRHAQRVVILTGNGVAAESGVPTFKDAQTGEWASYPVTDLATAEGFLRNPRLVWEWYSHRRRLVAACQPTDTHYALVDLEQFFPHFLLVTQSIDGLHWRAGSRDLLEMHGNMSRARCYECGAYAIGWDEEQHIPPLCPHDGGYLRPDIVWLGEGVPSQVVRQARDATRSSEVFLVVGASAEAQPTASLPLLAKRSGAYVIEINPHETALSLLVDKHVPEPPRTVLPWLAAYLLAELPENRKELP